MEIKKAEQKVDDLSQHSSDFLPKKKEKIENDVKHINQHSNEKNGRGSMIDEDNKRLNKHGFGIVGKLLVVVVAVVVLLKLSNNHIVSTTVVAVSIVGLLKWLAKD